MSNGSGKTPNKKIIAFISALPPILIVLIHLAVPALSDGMALAMLLGPIGFIVMLYLVLAAMRRWGKKKSV